MPIIGRNIVDRIQQFRAAWTEVAPDASFANLSLNEFIAATEAPLTTRTEIEALRRQLAGLKATRDQVDAAATELLELVVNSVRGTPGFGINSPLYRSMGYIRKDERKSGLTRKRTNSASPPANDDAA